jgi:hypothetical protein
LANFVTNIYVTSQYEVTVEGHQGMTDFTVRRAANRYNKLVVPFSRFPPPPLLRVGRNI